jgi:ankyrin repeat protein
MFDFCRFNDLVEFSPTLTTQLSNYLELKTGNTCLHIAAEYGNLNMIKYILKNKLINANTVNKDGDNPLFHTLRHSNHENF